MKRILTILLCLCLVVALAIPALAIDINPSDYIDGVEIEGNTEIVTFDINYTVFTDYTLELTNSSATTSFVKVWGDILTYTMPSTQKTWLIVSPFAEGDYLNVEDFPDSSTVRFNIRFSAYGSWSTSGAQVRYQLRWWDEDYNMIKYEVTDFDAPDQNLFGQYVKLNKPSTAKYLTVIAQVNNLTVNAGTTFEFEFLGLQFQMTKSSLADLENKVDKTNRLLEAIMNYKPIPDPPDFQQGLDDSNYREDVIIGSFEDGTLQNFGGNIVDASEYLGQFAATFAFVQQIWEPFIQLPWLNAILVCSLGLGLLGGFLGIFVTTSRTDSKGRGDD